jgi:hypothetical protein
MLRVTAVPAVARPGYTVLGWRVEDIAATVAGLSAGGVTFLRFDGIDTDDAGIWTTPGGTRWPGSPIPTEIHCRSRSSGDRWP